MKKDEFVVTEEMLEELKKWYFPGGSYPKILRERLTDAQDYIYRLIYNDIIDYEEVKEILKTLLAIKDTMKTFLPEEKVNG